MTGMMHAEYRFFDRLVRRKKDNGHRAMVAFGFLVIPLASGLASSGPVLLLVLLINLSLRKHQIAALAAHFAAVAYLIFDFLDAIKGELGRNSTFMVAHVIGVIICYFIYFFISSALHKAVRQKSLEFEDTTQNTSLSNIDESLITAVLANDLAKVKLLVENGANFRAKNADGYSAEDIARGGSLDAIREYFKNTPNNPLRQDKITR
jgi:hypothetical protein